MTTADMLRAEGEARGEARGRTAALVQLLTLKFGSIPQSALDTTAESVQRPTRAWPSE